MQKRLRIDEVICAPEMNSRLGYKSIGRETDLNIERRKQVRFPSGILICKSQQDEEIESGIFNFLRFFPFFFETGSHVAQAVLEFPMKQMMALNS